MRRERPAVAAEQGRESTACLGKLDHRLDSVAYCEDVVTDTEVVRCLLLLAMVAVKNRVDTPRHRRSGRVLQKRFSCVSTFPMSVPSLSR
jgi:hypothetical protein